MGRGSSGIIQHEQTSSHRNPLVWFASQLHYLFLNWKVSKFIFCLPFLYLLIGICYLHNEGKNPFQISMVWESTFFCCSLPLTRPIVEMHPYK